MKTEQATDVRDLPHAFDPPDGGAFSAYCKLCGLMAGHALHATPSPAEQAAEAAPTTLRRELGT